MCRTYSGQKRYSAASDQGTGGGSRVQFGTKNAETGCTHGE